MGCMVRHDLNHFALFEMLTFADRLFVTFALLVVFLRGISSARRGDGLRGQLVV